MEAKGKREQLKAYYHDEAARLQAETDRLLARGRAFVAAEIASFVAIIFFVVLMTLCASSVWRAAEAGMAVAMFAAYVAIRNADVRNSRRAADKERLRKAYANEEAYMLGDLSAFDDGSRYADPHHPFTYDMDIFGQGGLYQRVNRTATTGGADRLAQYLASVDAHGTKEEIDDYRAAIAALARDAAPWRMVFISCGVDQKIDTGAILRSLPLLRQVAIPALYGGAGVKAAAWLLIVGLAASIVAAVYGLVNPLLPIAWVFVNYFVVQGLANKRLGEMLKLGNQLHGQMQPLMRLVRHVGGRQSDGVMAVQAARLAGAEGSFAALTDIVETLVLRTSPAYKFFADAFGLRGLFLVAKFYRWRGMASDNLTEWIAAVSEIDALVSMAQFGAVHPEAGQAEVVETPGGGAVVFEGKGLWHPFLGAKAVRNDFSIKDRNFYIVTGANMAGKSTFLRTIGVNYILAMNGMAVFAESLAVSRFRLFTSMRTTDDLTHGISYFNAELLRLRQLIESTQASPAAPASPLNPLSKGEGRDYLQDAESLSSEKHSIPSPLERGLRGEATLIILDEILKGTNSMDKLNGSRMFLRAMEDRPVTGIIATHDLELSKMDAESPRFHNYCFEIELGSDVTYSYKITPGVARNQNATFLLRQLLDDGGKTRI